ncbi:MAG: HAMP domain-containing sensor histidine kinase [Oscillospiraceae bacterium]
MNTNHTNLIIRLNELKAKLPPFLRGLKGVWLAGSVLCIFDVCLAIYLALRGHAGWALFFSFFAVLLPLLSNIWFRFRVINPILGLGDMARRIAEGSYGTLCEKFSDDEIGILTEAINDMSVKIGAAGKTQSDFISSVSHELRTPLTAITGWGETLLYDSAIQGDSRRGVEIISKEAGRLTNMVEELLEFTRIRDGRFTLNLEPVDLCSETEDVVFTYGELLRQEELQLLYEPPEGDIPPITGDPRRLKQVILNILDNAAKYGRGGGSIELSIAQAGEYVTLTVRDHGPGIPAQELPHVKERFYKGKSKERGSGIGLAVCDEIITRHGGSLIVENAEGGGTLVTVRLPVKTQ